MKVRKLPQVSPHTLFTSLLILLDISGCIIIAVLLSHAIVSGHTGQAQEIIPQTELQIVSQDTAVSTAFTDAGVDNSCVKTFSCELNYNPDISSDSGIYQISFETDFNKYNYQISSVDGQILSYTTFYPGNNVS